MPHHTYIVHKFVWAWPDPLPICYAGKGLATNLGSAVLDIFDTILPCSKRLPH